MRTQTHKSHVIDDLLEEVDNLSIHFGWGAADDLYRSDLSLVRKDVLNRLYMILSEARVRLVEP